VANPISASSAPLTIYLVPNHTGGQGFVPKNDQLEKADSRSGSAARGKKVT
jgi:hypothetical protein